MMTLPNDIDPGIRPLVEMLILNGLETVSSCEGGEGHACPSPTINVRPMWDAPSPMAETEGRIARVLIANGFSGFSISQVHHYQSDDSPWKPKEMSHVEVRFWQTHEALAAQS